MVSGDHFPSFLISNLWLPTNVSNKVTWSHSRNSNLWCLESLPVCALEVPTFFSRISQMEDVSICRKWRNSTNLRISRWGDEREAVWRASSDASAGGLACPVGSASLFVDRPAGCIVCIGRLAWFARCPAFCIFCPRRAPVVVSRPHASMLADESSKLLIHVPLASSRFSHSADVLPSTSISY